MSWQIYIVSILLKTDINFITEQMLLQVQRSLKQILELGI
jgi:hypothetical protein